MNLAGDARIEAMLEALERWQEATPPIEPSDAAVPDEATRKRLESLGYL